MSSLTALTLFQLLPDELFVKILSGISIADFACSSPILCARVSRLSKYFPFKMPVKHSYLPLLRDYKRSFTSFMLNKEITVVALGAQRVITLRCAIEFFMQYLLLQAAGERAFTHPSVVLELLKVGCQASC